MRRAAPPPTGYFVARLIAYQPLWWSGDALCWLLFHTWPLLAGLLVRAFFTSLQANEPVGLGLPAIVVLAAVLGVSRAGIVFFASVAGGQQRFRVRALLWHNLMMSVLRRPGARALPGTAGEALSTLRDDVRNGVETTDLVFDAVAAFLFAVGALAILLRVDARVTLFVFMPITAVIAVAHAVRARLTRVREQSREATARMTGAIGEVFASVQAIQVAAAEERVLTHLRRLGDQRRRTMVRDALQRLWVDAVFKQTADLGAGLVLLVAAARMRAGSFTVGDLALFSTYLMQVSDFTGFLGYLINTYRQSGVSFRRLTDMLQGEPAARLVEHCRLVLDGPTRSPVDEGGGGPVGRPTDAPARTLRRSDRLRCIEVSGLTYHHPDSGRGITDVSFRLERGTVTVITGRLGAGKTTLVRTLLGLLQAERGEVRWNGELVHDPATFFVPPRAAYTAQVPTLLSGTIEDNIRSGWPSDAAQLNRAVLGAVLERDLAEFPAGPATVIGARGMRLSGGQVQRVAAARMFVREAELLVCDDVSSALDADTERLFWARAFERDATWLIISHRPAILARADQVLVMEAGRIIDRSESRES